MVDRECDSLFPTQIGSLLSHRLRKNSRKGESRSKTNIPLYHDLLLRYCIELDLNFSHGVKNLNDDVIRSITNL